jgi:voltage-gated potassium channel
VVLLCVVFTATLYHVSVPVRTSWRYNLPGAALTLVIWVVGSAVLRWFLTVTAGGSTSIYGPLAAPIALMIWLYILAIAVLIGAALNASFDQLWPESGPARARIELMRRLRRHARLPRMRKGEPVCDLDADQQPPTTLGAVRFPHVIRSPWSQLSRRILLATAILVLTVLLVYVDRRGYTDMNDPAHRVDLSDAVYYAAVTLSTTGYGDIAPASQTARLVNAFVITPLRIGFLVLLIATTLQLMSTQGREVFRATRWRRRMNQHVVVVGYGTKGRSAIETLVGNGRPLDKIVVVDPNRLAVQEANNRGLTVVVGDATRRDVLRRAGAEQAAEVMVTTDRDDSTILAVLNVRQLNPSAYIVAVVRESDNVPLVRQSGADAVVTSSDAVGRLLGLSTVSPALGSVMEDLLSYGEGLEVAERDLLVPEVGKRPQQLSDQVVAVIRDGNVHPYYDPVVTQLARGDRLIVVRPADELPWAPRPGTHGEDTTQDG